jgi:hypothetical protein
MNTVVINKNHQLSAEIFIILNISDKVDEWNIKTKQPAHAAKNAS